MVVGAVKNVQASVEEGMPQVAVSQITEEQSRGIFSSIGNIFRRIANWWNGNRNTANEIGETNLDTENRENEEGSNIEPYPHIYRQDIHAIEILQKYSDLGIEEHRKNDIYQVAGRFMLRRKMGKAAFYDIHDETGRIQIYLQKPELTEEENNLLPNLDIGDFIGVKVLYLKQKLEKLRKNCKHSYEKKIFAIFLVFF